MENILIKDYKVPVSSCDNKGTLSIAGIFDLFMDMATEHGSSINLGMDDLAAKGCFWVAAKSRIQFTSRPHMLQNVTVSSWPEKPGNIRCNRYYTIADNNQVIVEGKTEWTILDSSTGRPKKSAEIYPQGLEHLEDVVCPEPFSRIGTDFTDCEEILSYIVTSRDIDVSQHMNNVAYIRAVLSAFSCSELESMNITSLEVAYRAQCYEGEVLSIRKRIVDNGMEIGVVKEDGKTATTLSITCG
ncbi:MAG: hypothetical protein IJ298_02135 [Ruminococcus sp.]|nr:hypothetical protein [Ruminococcus sp.]